MKKYARLCVIVAAFLLCTAALQAATTIVAAPASVAVSYQVGAGPGTAVIVKIGPSAGATGSIYWTVSAASLPAWLVLDKSNGTATAASATSVSFNANPFAATLGAGTYTANVVIQSAPLTDLTIPVTLTVKNAPAQISAALSPSSIVWKPGDTLPTVALTVKSSGDSQNYTITTAVTNPTTSWFTLASSAGVAYSWGSDIGLTFVKSAFDNATIGKPLTGTITVKGQNNTVTVPLSITIGVPTITVTAIQPSKLPKVPSGTGTRTIAVTGTGFADGMAVKLNGSATAIANNCAAFNAATGNAVCIQSPTRFFLKLTEATDLKPGTDITLHVESATFNIPVTTNPIIYSVANSASFQEVNSGNQTVAPYEMISIFGDNFIKAGDVQYGAVSAGRYPNKLTSNSVDLTVHFQDVTGTPADLANDSDAYLLFATSSQINLLVPSSLTGVTTLQAVVNYGSAASDPVTLDVALSHPGLFASLATGAVIAMNSDGTVNSSATPAKFGANSYVTLYASGLGEPHDGTSDVDGGASAAAPAGCVKLDKALAGSGGGTPWATLDGGLIDATAMVGTNTLPPCFGPNGVSVSIGGKGFTGAGLPYVGWAAGLVAGLNQINVALPANNTGMTPTTTGGSAYNVTLTINNVTSPSAIVYIK